MTKTFNLCLWSATAGLAVGITSTVGAWIGAEIAKRGTLTYQAAAMLERCAAAGQDGMAMLTIKQGTQVTCSLPQEIPVKPKKVY